MKKKQYKQRIEDLLHEVDMVRLELSLVKLQPYRPCLRMHVGDMPLPYTPPPLLPSYPSPFAPYYPIITRGSTSATRVDPYVYVDEDE